MVSRPIFSRQFSILGLTESCPLQIGNHRDAWILGASDPSSGTAVTHEVYKGLGKLIQKGWKPLRSIYIGSWDAEECEHATRVMICCISPADLAFFLYV